MMKNKLLFGTNDEAVRDMFKHVLPDLGYTVFDSGNLEEMVGSLLLHQPFNIIAMDINLRSKQNDYSNQLTFEPLRIIYSYASKHPYIATTRFIAFSGNEKLVVRARSELESTGIAGVEVYLKPFSMELFRPDYKPSK